jgi:hypothetical protein
MTISFFLFFTMESKYVSSEVETAIWTFFKAILDFQHVKLFIKMACSLSLDSSFLFFTMESKYVSSEVETAIWTFFKTIFDLQRDKLFIKMACSLSLDSSFRVSSSLSCPSYTIPRSLQRICCMFPVRYELKFIYPLDVQFTLNISCGGGVEYLHRSPASRTMWRKGNPVSGGITVPLSSRGIQIRESVPPGWWSLESETIKHGHESSGTRTWEWLRWWGPAEIVNGRAIFSSESVLHQNYGRKCSVEKILMVSLKELVTSRKVTLTLTRH